MGKPSAALTKIKENRTCPWLGEFLKFGFLGERSFASMEDTQANPGGADEPIPFMQQLLDNPFLLLFLGVTFPTVFYILWGIMEITAIPIAN